MLRFALTLALLVAFACPIASAQQEVVLTNKDIIELVRAEISSEILVAKIKASLCQFDTSPAQLLELKAHGVPEAVILAMVQAAKYDKVDGYREGDTIKMGAATEASKPQTLSPAMLAEREHRDSICPTCKFILISGVDSRTGTVTDNWVSKDQNAWLKKRADDATKGKARANLLITSHRENADYILFWTSAQGFRPYVLMCLAPRRARQRFRYVQHYWGIRLRFRYSQWNHYRNSNLLRSSD